MNELDRKALDILGKMQSNRTSAIAHLQETGVILGHEPAVIRAGIAEHCKALGLDRDERIRCENIGLDIYWTHARSNGWCIAAGVREAETIARHRKMAHQPTGAT